jgi:hypothetical protein
MSHRTSINDSDEGKTVVNANGEEIGIVSEVSGGTAHVDPDPGLTDKLMAKLGWDEADRETYPLSASSIEEITNNEVRLSRDL